MRHRLWLVLVTSAVALVGLPSADATVEATADNPIGAEAWYQLNPTCGMSLGCAQVPATSAYPAGTLHVGFSAGQETARTYLVLEQPELPQGATVTGGTLTIPLDTAVADGSASPDTARLKVCTATGAVTAVEGSFETPPAVACTLMATTAYVATPTPHLKADLTPLASVLGNKPISLALLPADGVAPNDAWHVVFSSHTRQAPATVRLTFSAQQKESSDVPAVPADPGPSGANPPALLSAPLPRLTAEPPAQVPVVRVASAQPAVQSTTVRAPRNGGYAYPGVWLLPIAGLGLAIALGRLLTSDLTPAPRRTTPGMPG